MTTWALLIRRVSERHQRDRLSLARDASSASVPVRDPGLYGASASSLPPAGEGVLVDWSGLHRHKSSTISTVGPGGLSSESIRSAPRSAGSADGEGPVSAR